MLQGVLAQSTSFKTGNAGKAPFDKQAFEPQRRPKFNASLIICVCVLFNVVTNKVPRLNKAFESFSMHWGTRPPGATDEELIRSR